MMAGMAGRYAAALFELAKEQKQLEQVERDVASFQALLEGSADLVRGWCAAPSFPPRRKRARWTPFLPRSAFPGLQATF